MSLYSIFSVLYDVIIGDVINANVLIANVLIAIGLLVLILGIENPIRAWAAAPHRRG